jgi:cytochrome P450
MTHDSTIFPSPEEFRPERWVEELPAHERKPGKSKWKFVSNKDGVDPRVVIFGYGRR